MRITLTEEILMIKFSKELPNIKNIHLGTGYFDVTVDNPVVAQLLSQNQVEQHYTIAKDLILKKGTLTFNGYDGDIYAVFKNSNKTNNGWCTVYFDYYLT